MPGATERRPAPAAPHWFGLVSDAYPIWNSKAVELTVPVGRERWVEHLLPGLGLNTVRLVAVRLPSASSLSSDDLIARFDAARRYFDLGEYRASIQGLRDLRTAVEDAFGATAADPLPNRIAALRGMKPGDPVPAFFVGLRDALAALDNPAHHDILPHAASDARTALLVTAVFLESIQEMQAS